MAVYCVFPLCKRVADKDGLCIGHRKTMGRPVPESKPAQKPIPKRSEKMKAAMKEYKPKVQAFLARPENKQCKIKGPNCRGRATCVHHTAGRTGTQLLNEDDYMAACEPCNGWAEDNDGAARAKGVKKTRITKSSKRPG